MTRKEIITALKAGKQVKNELFGQDVYLLPNDVIVSYCEGKTQTLSNLNTCYLLHEPKGKDWVEKQLNYLEIHFKDIKLDFHTQYNTFSGDADKCGLSETQKSALRMILTSVVEEHNEQLLKVDEGNLRDKNGNIISKMMEVDVPYPNDSDIHTNGFNGTVIGFRGGNVQVQDGDGDVFDIEPERLEIIEF